MTNATKVWVVAVGLLVAAQGAYGWGGPTHKKLATFLLDDPVIAPLIPSSLNVSEVKNWGSEPPDSWHHPGWSMIQSRGYLTNYDGQNWPGLDETTRVKYLIHIATDCGVPLGHSPAREVYTHTINEALLELQVAAWQDYPSIVGKSSYQHSRNGYETTFTGTYSEIVNKFYAACKDNASWFKGTRNWAGAHSTDDNKAGGWNGTTLGLYLARAMLADYFLAQKPTVASAGGTYRVKSGGAVTLSSEGSYDPDSITWTSEGTYYNNGGGFTCTWDLDGDGVYETSGASPTMTHSQLVSLVGYTEGKTVTLRVADKEPGLYQSTSYDTATVAVYSDPVANAGGDKLLPFNGMVELRGNGYDPDGGDITQWRWTISGGDTMIEQNGRNLNLTWQELFDLGCLPGEQYELALWVKDNDGDFAGTHTDYAMFTMAIPEPTTLSLFAIGAIALIRRRCKGR